MHILSVSLYKCALKKQNQDHSEHTIFSTCYMMNIFLFVLNIIYNTVNDLDSLFAK